MIDYQVMKSGRTNSGRIICQVDFGGSLQEWRFTDIKAAFVWEPKPYFLMIGEETLDRYDAFPDKRGIFILLDEWESPSLSLMDFLARLTDTLFLFSANDIFADLSKKEYSDLFYDYQSKHGLSHLSLIQAPFAENFRLGMSMVQDLVSQGGLRLPKNSLVWNSLETLTPTDIDNEPEKRFPRLRALAFGVCGLLKHGGKPKLSLRNTINLRGGKGPGWML